MSTVKTGSKVGRNATHYGVTLPLATVDGGVSYPDVVEVEGVAYYVHDFGGVFVGSREVSGTVGGNEVHAVRTAPESRIGVAAPVRGVLGVRATYSEPEIFFDN